MRFSAATTADRLLPERLALRARPLLGRVDAVLFSADERGEAGRMSVIAFAIRIVSAAIAFVSQVFLARWMGSFEYGIFVLVWVTMVIAGNVSCLGFHTSVIRFIPEYREKGMLAELRGILVASRLFVLVASSVIAALGALCVVLLSPDIESYYVVPFVLGFVCLPMIALSDLLQGLSRANSWAVFALSPTYLVRPVLILVLMGGSPRRRLPARRPDRADRGDPGDLPHHHLAARRRHRPHRPQAAGWSRARCISANGSPCRCRSSWSRASSSCSPMPTC